MLKIMSHHHKHNHKLSGFRLFITIILNVLITLSEIIGAIYSGSLALLGDALHNFSDVLALIISWIAHRLSYRQADYKKTFGYKRAEILAALLNSSVLLALSFFLMYRAVLKFLKPVEVKSLVIIYLAILSIFLNALSVLIIKKDAKNSLNIKSAYLHLLTDVMTSIAVLLGGLGIMYFKIYWIDPLISLFIALYLIKESFFIVKETLFILMQFAPRDINVKDIEKAVKTIDLIENIHHIHLWRLDDSQIFLEAHLDFKENADLKKVTEIIIKIEKMLKDRFNISHVTLQSEFQKKDDKSLVINEKN